MDGEIEQVLLEFDRSGSLPTTHDSQGSDMGLFGGLLGWDADDERLPNSAQALQQAGIALCIATVDVGDPHPNTYRLTLSNSSEQHSLIAISTGGGMIEVLSIDGLPLQMDGGYHETLLWLPKEAPELDLEADEVIRHSSGETTILQVKAQTFLATEVISQLRPLAAKYLAPVLPVPSRKNMQLPFDSCTAMLELDAGNHTPLWQLAIDYERHRGGIGEEEILAKMVDIVRILRKSIASGIAGTQYEDRVLHHQSGKFQDLMNAGRLLDGGALNRVLLYVTALMEVKSSMGIIVAAPTAGACAALPGAVIAMAESMQLDEMEMAKAMLAAGLIGVFISTRWTFAAEVGGVGGGGIRGGDGGENDVVVGGKTRRGCAIGGAGPVVSGSPCGAI